MFCLSPPRSSSPKTGHEPPGHPLKMLFGLTHFGLAVHPRLSYLRGMSQTLEKRVAELEKKVAELSAQPIRPNRKKDWRRSIGVFRNDPDFEEAARLGRKYREQQTYAKEIARS